jgi:hypothetical protein
VSPTTARLDDATQSLDARLVKSIRLGNGADARFIELSADIFNLPNFLNNNWGIVREATANERLEWLSVTGWDSPSNRPLYSIPTASGEAVLPNTRRIVIDQSRWRIQLGARIGFW